AIAVVDHPRDRHGRDARSAGDVLDRHIDGSRGHVESLVAIPHIIVAATSIHQSFGLTIASKTCYRYHNNGKGGIRCAIRRGIPSARHGGRWVSRWRSSLSLSRRRRSLPPRLPRRP